MQRLKDPFGVNSLIDRLSDMIPANGDLGDWIHDAIQEGMNYNKNANKKDDDDDDGDKKDDVHITVPTTTSKGNNIPTVTPQGNATNSANASPSKDADDENDSKDPFGISSLLSSLNSIFDGINSADEIVPS